MSIAGGGSPRSPDLPANSTKEIWIFRDYVGAPIIKAIG